MPLFPRMPRRVPKPTESLTGSGDLSVASDGRGGMVVRDGRPDGEWGRIASHVSANEYTAIRLDDGDTAYPDRDTLTVRCWELNGRTDVAVDTLVRLEANRAGDGFTFCGPPSGGGDAHFLAPVYCAATGPGTLATSFEAGDTLDGVTLTAGMSILIQYQASASENGVYTVNASGAPARRTDADSIDKINGALVPVLYGTTNARTLWQGGATLPASFSTQIWERTDGYRFGNVLYGSTYSATGSHVPVRNNTAPTVPSGYDAAVQVDDSPGYYLTTVYGGSVQFRGHELSFGSSPASIAAGYPTGVPIGFAAVTRTDTGLPTGTPIAVGVAAGLLIPTAVESGPSVDNPLVLRAVGDGTKFSFVELGGNTKPSSTNFRTYLRISGAAVTVSRSGGTATFDADGGYLVSGAAGLTGTLGPGAAATGGIITTLGSGSFVGTASANSFTNTNTFTAPSTSGTPLIAKGLAAQTGDLLQAQDNGATVRARIEADGEIEAASGAARLNVSSSNGQLALYNNAGATYATLTAGASNVLAASGGFTTGGALTVSSGGLTVSAGGANITGTVTAADGSGIAQLNASNLSSGTVAAARLPIGTSVQAWDADLDSLAALSGTNTIYYRSAANTWSAVTVGTGLSFSGGTLSNTGSSLDITGLTATDFGWRDEVPVYSQENAANRKLDVERIAAVAHCPPPGRLTLDSALPVTTADVTSSSTLYYLSLNGDRLRLWDGTRYVVRRIGTGLVTTQSWTSSKNYDVWAYASAYTPSATNTGTDVVTVATSPPTGSSVLCTTSAGGLTVGTVYYWNQASGTTGSFHATLANALAGTSKVDLTANVTGVLLFASLETLVWTNDSTRATALALTDGLYHKSGDQTRLYLGTVRVGSLGTIFDTVAARGVWNVHNRRKRAMRAVKTSGSWTYATNTWRSANADATLRCELVLGIAEDAVVGDVAINLTGSGSAGAVGIGLDQTAGNDAQIVCEAGPAGTTDVQTTRARYAGTPAAGYHYLQWVEKVRAGTSTFRADLTPSVGLEVEVWG